MLLIKNEMLLKSPNWNAPKTLLNIFQNAPNWKSWVSWKIVHLFILLSLPGSSAGSMGTTMIARVLNVETNTMTDKEIINDLSRVLALFFDLIWKRFYSERQSVWWTVLEAIIIFWWGWGGDHFTFTFIYSEAFSWKEATEVDVLVEDIEGG